MVRAVVRALPVHHHRAREHDSTDACTVRRAQQRGRAQVVGGDVVDDVVDVHTEPDLRCQVHDDVRTCDDRDERLLVPHVAHDQVRPRQWRVRTHEVDDGHVMAVRHEPRDRGPTDEPGSAGDKDAHPASMPRTARPGA